MKKPFSAFLIFLALLFGCTPSPQKKLNFSEQMKMLKAAADRTTADSNQVKAILAYLERQYYLDNISETREYVAKAQSISNKIGYGYGKAACAEYIAGLYLSEHQFDSAKRVLDNDTLLKLYGDEKWKIWHEFKLILLGLNLKTIKPDNAVLLYRKCENRFNKIEHNLGAGICNQNIGYIYLQSGQTDSFLFYTNKALKIYEKAEIPEQLEGAYMNLGVAYYYKGNLNRAIENMFKSNTLSEMIGNKENQIMSLMNIAEIYNLNHQFNQCEKICRKLLGMIKPPYTPAQHALLSGVYVNLGTAYNSDSYLSNQDSLIRLSNMAMYHLRKSNYTAQNMGQVYSNYGYALSMQGKFEEALRYSDTGLLYAESVENPIEIAGNYVYRSYIFKNINNLKEAISYGKKAIDIAQETGDFLHMKDAALSLKDYYHSMGNCVEELKYAEIYYSARDSFESKDQAAKFAEAETQKTYELKIAKDKAEQDKVAAVAQKESQKQKILRNSFFSGFALTSLLAFIWFRSYKRKKKDNIIITKEKERSENLLLNILPAEVAEELKIKGESEAKDFDEVTVLFTDFKSFTQFSEKVSAKELVAELNTCFKFFDGVMEKYNIEKIKTIGDSYMAAGGLQGDEMNVARRVVQAGLEMQNFIQKLKHKRESEGSLAFDMRVGIHTGPVVAGIVGVKKFAYDIWGDTVNTASRMESSGAPGAVNISEFTYALIKDEPEFVFTPRGKVMAKGKGEMDMYFVELRNREEHVH